MQTFLKNLLLLAALAFVVFLVAPDMMRQVMALFGGIGLLPVMLVLVVLAALPRRRRR